MLKAELLELIANGESSGVEFKRDDVRPEQLAKEIVAFANFQGGRVLLGVEDDGTIRWMAFAGDTKEYQALDDVVLDGPLVALTQPSQSGSHEVVEPGLLKRTIERMAPFVSTEDAQIDESLRRQRRWHYPIEALREALVNAMVHRDWTRSLEVEVVAYSDRIEITSPGALQNSMTIEKMLAGQRSPRNHPRRCAARLRLRGRPRPGRAPRDRASSPRGNRKRGALRSHRRLRARDPAQGRQRPKPWRAACLNPCT